MGQVGPVGRAFGLALTAIVVVHLAISIVHGQAHAGADVPLSSAAAAFVYIIILAGPILGLAVFCWRPHLGAWIVALSMSGALIFGLVNHFIIAGPDHVAHVAAEWRTLFGVTAALLVASEAAGVAIAIRSALRAVRRTS